MGLFWQPQMLSSILLALPLMTLGLALGHKVHLGITHRQQLAVIGILLLISGISLFWKVWAEYPASV